MRLLLCILALIQMDLCCILVQTKEKEMVMTFTLQPVILQGIGQLLVILLTLLPNKKAQGIYTLGFLEI
jgi:hypothetical protein